MFMVLSNIVVDKSKFCELHRFVETRLEGVYKHKSSACRRKTELKKLYSRMNLYDYDIVVIEIPTEGKRGCQVTDTLFETRVDYIE